MTVYTTELKLLVDIYGNTHKKPRLQTGLRRDVSLYIFIPRLYHVSTKIRNGEH